MKILACFVVAAVAAGYSHVGSTAPQEASPQSRPSAPAANPKDVESIDAIIAALYDVISGPAGQERNWNRFRSLFMRDARLMMARERPDGTSAPLSMTPEDYIQRAGPMLVKDGFFENEIARKMDAFGLIAHAFSTYESRHKSKDEAPFSRGINSIQLMKDKDRWWVVSVYWCAESEKHPIPAEYLKK